jgi:citrate lyase subunit beta/citryl-CoA lyase
MSARSLLFAPGDSDKKLAKALGIGADIVIFDLEDSVAASAKAAARDRVREFIVAHRQRTNTELWVRINPLDSPESLADLSAVVVAGLAGILQPKIRNAQDVMRLGETLERLESASGITLGSTKILPVATEMPEALFGLGELALCGPRLYGVTWGAEDLSAALGAQSNTDEQRRWTAPYQLARSLCLFAAGAARVAPIDTVYVNFRDAVGLRESCVEAYRDGFVGKMAIHPDQVAIIHECFAPSAQEIEHARRVVQLFHDNPGIAALSLNGQMLDIPHLRQAEKILARRR